MNAKTRGRCGRTRPRPKSRRAHQLAPSRPTKVPPTELSLLQSLRQHQARRTPSRRSRGGNRQADQQASLGPWSNAMPSCCIHPHLPLSTRRAAGQARFSGAGDRKRRSSLPMSSVDYKPGNLQAPAQARARHLRPRGILSSPAAMPPWRTCQPRQRQIPPGHAEGKRI